MDQLPDDYRERQRKRWEQSKSGTSNSITEAQQAQAKSAAPSSSSSAGPTTSSAQNDSTTSAAELTEASANLAFLRKLHILPVAARADGRAGLSGNLDFISPALREMRDERRNIMLGSIFTVRSFDYTVVGIDPDKGGMIGPQTEFYLEGEPLRALEKVQFLALTDLDSTTLFNDYVGPYFKKLFEPPADRRQLKTIVILPGQTFDINGVNFTVRETLPSGSGYIDKQTLVYVDSDNTPEFEKIHVVPFHDTLPRAYEFEVFNDYVKPFFKSNPHQSFCAQEHFTYQGVQFKVVCCEPAGPRRVGKTTTIFCDGVLHPSLRNLLPPDLLLQLSYLPPGLQMLLLNTDAIGSGDVYERLMDVQEMLQNRRGMSPETIDSMEHSKWDEHEDEDNKQTQCMVCLCDFENEEKVRKLPCSHVFHCACIDEWLRRCTDCPICKTNIDRMVRNY